MKIENFEVVNSNMILTINPVESEVRSILIIGFDDYPSYENSLDVSIYIEDKPFTVFKNVTMFKQCNDFLFAEIVYIEKGETKTKTLLFNNLTKYKQCLLESILKEENCIDCNTKNINSLDNVKYMTIRSLEYAIDIGYFNKINELVKLLNRLCGCFTYINKRFNSKCNEYER